jgi:hypothetical protein
MGLSEWLESQASASRLEACERALAHFCTGADADPEFMSQVGEAVWGLLLSTSPSADPMAILAEIREKLEALGRDRLDLLSSKLQQAMASGGGAKCEAGKLVASWFRAIALCKAAPSQNGRALHVTKAYERTFASLARLMNSTTDDGRNHGGEKCAA